MQPNDKSANSASARHRVSRSVDVAAGFTLIELMVVTVVIAILAAIAVPSYKDYVLRGRISDGQSSLAAFATTLQQYYQDNRTFVNACGTTGLGALPASSSYFSYSCSNLGATTFTATATGRGSTLGFAFTVDQDGNRQTTAVPTGWTTSTTCWVRNSSGSCN
ncbi:MAG: prepilin-type N-terminal cleavage/methylation domain-containing protein [Paucibacter sp.]|nr:prepilin-type N-terminal cleavage/methylation domain-containing protein [Roseateles sp.]